MAIEKTINIVANTKNAIDGINSVYKKILDTDKATEDLNETTEETADAYKDVAKEGEKSLDKQSKGMKAVASASAGVKKGVAAIGTALKALGIGIIIALVAKFTQVLSENQKVVDFVTTVSTTLSIVINGLINSFTDIFTKISEATGGFDALGKVVGGVLKIAFNSLKTIVLQLQAGFTALKLAYETVFGDDEGVEKAKKDLIDIGKKLKETSDDQVKQGKKIFDNIGEAFDEVVTGVTILAKDGIKAISDVDLKASYLQAQAITRNKQNFELLALQQARLQLSFQNQAELQRQIRDDDTKGLSERQKANDKLGEVLDKQFAAEKATISARIAGLQNEQNLLGATNERYNEIYQLQTDLIDVEERLNGQRSEQLTNTNTLLKEQKDLTQSQIDTQNEFAISQKEFEAEQAETELLKIERQREAIQLQIDIDKAELERKKLLYAEETQARADAENQFLLAKQATDQALIENSKATSEEIIANEKTVEEAKKAIQESTINTVSSGVALLGQLAGKSKALQKAAIVAESAVGLGKMLIANNTANIAALATPQAIATSGAAAVPVIALNNISTGIGVASTVAATAKALSALGGGGSAPTAGSVPSGGAAAPSFNLVQGTGSNQIAQSLTNESRPIQAFVVASSVTSQQELDRNANNEGTIG
tara:strand:- start:4479 stop:6449 length:1971 start_codon:yes stop_codon:yes gene_type:complete